LTPAPTFTPTTLPTPFPTFAPTTPKPTEIPTPAPTSEPTLEPTSTPTLLPTFSPTNCPSISPTFEPTTSPTFEPSKAPTNGDFFMTFVFTELRDCSAASLQIAELTFYDINFNIMPPTFYNVIGGKSPGGETIQKLFDQNKKTKWLDFNGGRCQELTIEITILNTVMYYAFTTANDSPDRDPIAWDLTVCSAAECWFTKQEVADVPEERHTQYPILDLSLLWQPVYSPTQSPSVTPTDVPTFLPSQSPTVDPTASPTDLPTTQAPAEVCEHEDLTITIQCLKDYAKNLQTDLAKLEEDVQNLNNETQEQCEASKNRISDMLACASN